MPPRARSTGPEFMSSPTVGDLIAAVLDEAANPRPDGEHHTPTPIERAQRSMVARAAAELREHHAPGDET